MLPGPLSDVSSEIVLKDYEHNRDGLLVIPAELLSASPQCLLVTLPVVLE